MFFMLMNAVPEHIPPTGKRPHQPPASNLSSRKGPESASLCNPGAFPRRAEISHPRLHCGRNIRGKAAAQRPQSPLRPQKQSQQTTPQKSLPHKPRQKSSRSQPQKRRPKGRSASSHNTYTKTRYGNRNHYSDYSCSHLIFSGPSHRMPIRVCGFRPRRRCPLDPRPRDIVP